MSSEPTPYDAAIIDIEGRIQYFQGMLESLKQLRSQTTGSPLPQSASGSSRSEAGTEIHHDSFFGMTIGEAANKYLKNGEGNKSYGGHCQCP